MALRKTDLAHTACTTLEGQLEQWCGRTVEDTVTLSVASQNQSGTPHMKASESESLLMPSHRGKTWSGA